MTFAAAVAARLGRRPTVITYAQTDTDFSVLPPQTELILHPSATTTCFANIYTPQGRIQYCYTPAPTDRTRPTFRTPCAARALP